MTERDVRRVAKERFGWDRLRPGQFEAIDAAVSGRDVLAMMPTDYGNSAIYQLAAAFIPGPTVVVSPLIAWGHDFDRPNLRLEVVRHSTDADKRYGVVEQVLARPKPGLVYVSTRKDTAEYSAERAQRGLSAAGYHADLRTPERRETHRTFLVRELDVVVATSAFGMGVDKPDLRFVIHAAITESLDAYSRELVREHNLLRVE